eukprot:CAMPEP_0117792982 /NCGR_PEP_ID=MMETSP0948-20121206/9767_1 /TAXON_ID=44440 /ORGANISM="Chattonella subsalsa, Strain CCMP2191" /LENGTH=89 /DNA_ID=CAMNT_0005623311 /DNA_START=950 /DNA_END=1219 /DNA_ORIENTATION=+
MTTPNVNGVKVLNVSKRPFTKIAKGKIVERRKSSNLDQSSTTVMSRSVRFSSGSPWLSISIAAENVRTMHDTSNQFHGLPIQLKPVATT